MQPVIHGDASGKTDVTENVALFLQHCAVQRNFLPGRLSPMTSGRLRRPDVKADSIKSTITDFAQRHGRGTRTIFHSQPWFVAHEPFFILQSISAMVRGTRTTLHSISVQILNAMVCGSQPWFVAHEPFFIQSQPCFVAHEPFFIQSPYKSFNAMVRDSRIILHSSISAMVRGTRTTLHSISVQILKAMVRGSRTILHSSINHHLNP